MVNIPFDSLVVILL